MSNTGALAFVQQLKERAKKGDKLALAELKKIRAIGAQYKRVAEQMAADGAADEIVQGEEDDEAIGEDTTHFSGDKLEQAEFVANKFANADGLVQKVELRNHGWKGLNDVAKFARVNPPSVMQGTLGGQQTVSVLNNPSGIQVINWSGDDEETVPLSCTFAPVARPGDSTRTIRPYAIIQFGTRGFSVRAEIDIGLGVQLTVSGSSITGQVALDPIDSVGADSTLTMAGMLSFYPIVRTAPLTRTQYVNGPDNSTILTIPAFAKNVRIYTPTNASDITLSVRDSSDFLLYQYIKLAAVTMFDPLPLSADAKTIGFTFSAGTPTRMRVIYELSL